MNKILNFHQSTDRIATAGQPGAEQFAEIAAAGYTTVINLAMHDSDNAIPEEGNIVASLGMSYIHMPVPFDAPSAPHVKKFFRLMDALEGEKVFVHCALNARVSAFMYCYLTLKKGSSAAGATSPLLQQWLPQMDTNWRAIVSLTSAELGLGTP